MIDTYSLIAAVLLFNIAMIIVALVQRRMGYLAVYSTHALVFLAVLNALCITLPFKFRYAPFVYSYTILPAINNTLYGDRWQTSYSLFNIILLLWSIGSLVMLIKTVVTILKERNYQKKYRTVDKTRAEHAAQNLQLKRVEITVSPDVVIPYVTGLFKARIYLPDIEMADDTLELILKHEYQHYRSRDILTKTFYLMLSIVFWWNPVSHIFMREFDRMLEVQCDAAIVKHMSEDEKTSYMESLLSIAKHVQTVNTKPPVSISSFAITEQYGFMEQRFRLIQSDKNVKNRRIQLASVAAVVLVFLSTVMINVQPMYRNVPVRKYFDPPHPFAGPARPMRLLSEEEMEQRGITRDFIIIDQGNGVEKYIINPESLPDRNERGVVEPESSEPD